MVELDDDDAGEKEKEKLRLKPAVPFPGLGGEKPPFFQ